MEEYFYRVAYSNENFNSWGQGWETDMGMIYILFGPPDEVQRSNMSKLDENGKPIYNEDGKVLKGPNYFKPNFEKFIK